MDPGVKAVKPLDNYRLLLTFENREQRFFDMKPYLDRGIFAELRDENLFRSVNGMKRHGFDGRGVCPGWTSTLNPPE